ncbi:NUDIX hydrolase [Baekduia soli]|uniref:NUDIX hydrolase n=1 Tax=Baekduia soli TaxID=496014 RepID=A0A5B8U0N3_9ACTN|nr:NUDIX hydrolase [Baekduia soli]QEC46584.1 NUDIX hydrolase [Baekduia soli]
MARSGGASAPSEHSAGGVVVRDGADCVVIVPTRRAASGSRVVALPKGHVDPGETPPQAAAREVREEAGVHARLVDPLGSVRYWYMRDGRRIAKRVDFFLFAYVWGDVGDHDHEVERAFWMPLQEAAQALSYEGERQMAARALSRMVPDG